MDWYEDEVAALERTTRDDTFQSRPLFYGSSSFRLWDTLAEDLDSDRIVNRAFGGSTLAACVHFFERLVPPVHPISLTLYAGDNDLGDGQSMEQVVGSFRRFLEKMDTHLPEAPFAFLGIKPSPARWHILDRIAGANQAITDLMAARNHDAVFIDTMAAMTGPDGKPNRTLFLEDGLHLSRDGYKLWASLIWPYRQQLLIEPKPCGNTDRVASG